jgi:SnoaL-like domain
MTQYTAVGLARDFWRLMASNDFYSVAAVLAPEFVLEWPQSGERIRGAQNFGRMNHEYEAHGPWRFNIVRLVGNNLEAVTEVDITDGKQQAKAISFFTVEGGKISRLVEYWPEPYAPRADRAHLTEPIE